MRCKKVLERLDDHVDGLLAAPEAEAIRDHLDACTDCRETSLAVTAASASLATWNDAEPPADTYSKILARLEALPVEAFEHHPAPARGLWERLPRFETVRAARVRWMATSGLAAAAAVLAAVLISRTETHPIRRVRLQPDQNSVVNSSASWFQGYDFDNGLYYPGSKRPLAQPARFAPGVDQLQATPR